MARFAVVSPRNGDTIDVRNSLIVWRRATGASQHYRFTLTDLDGAVLWSKSVPDTFVTVPPQIELNAGESYYWYVDALLDRGRTATTGISKFVVEW